MVVLVSTLILFGAMFYVGTLGLDKQGIYVPQIK